MSDLATTYAALILADEGLEITAEKINTLVSAAKIEIEPIWATLLAKVCHVDQYFVPLDPYSP